MVSGDQTPICSIKQESLHIRIENPDLDFCRSSGGANYDQYSTVLFKTLPGTGTQTAQSFIALQYEQTEVAFLEV